MGSELSVIVGEFLDYEEFPSAQKKVIVKKFAKAIRGKEKEVGADEMGFFYFSSECMLKSGGVSS